MLNFLKKLRRLSGIVLLLGCLPHGAFAFNMDYIIEELAKLVGFAALFAVLLLGVILGLAKLARSEQKAVIEAESRPFGPDHAAWRVVVAALLVLPLNVIWFNLTVAREEQALMGQVIVSCLMFALPTAAVAVHLWRTKRPGTAWGIGVGAALVLVGLLFAGDMQRRKAHEAEVAGLVVPVGPDATRVYDASEVDQLPQFAGGPDSLRACIQRRIQYPMLLRTDLQSGTVRLGYVVGVDGRVLSVEVLQGMGPAYDNEASRVLEGLPVFDPGRLHQEVVAVRCTTEVALHKPPAAKK